MRALSHSYWLFLALLLLTSLGGLSSGFCQGESNIWYFGNFAGLDFNGGAPVAISGSNMSTVEGCATISDSNGVLLMYTDGSDIWDANHAIMPNGSGLLGTFSATQSSIIVPRPGNPSSIYYVFTVDNNAGINGLRYSEVDMALNCGLGDVVALTKNTLLQTPVTEKLSAVRHANGEDVWVLAHDWGNSDYLAYLVSSAGISSTPIVSTVGMPHSGATQASIGYMKFSIDGSKVATVNTLGDSIEVFDFDNSTGILSNPLSWPAGFVDPYGVEFSPNGKILYVSGWFGSGGVHQYDLLAGSSTAIAASTIKLSPNNTPVYGALQLGPDGKIYAAKHTWGWMLGSIAAIHSPNSLGVSANFDDFAVFISSGLCHVGLPSFIQSSILSPQEIAANDTCFGDSALLEITNTSGVDSVQWNFGDPLSGSLNNATGLSVLHAFIAPGQYTITAIVHSNQGTTVDTLIDSITIHEMPIVYLGADTTLCEGASITLAPPSITGSTYSWQDASTNSTYNVTTANTYWVDVTMDNCTSRDSVVVTYNSLPAVDLGNDTIICIHDSILLTASTVGDSYLWSTNATDPTVVVSDAGIYWLEITTNNCTHADTLILSITDAPNIQLAADTTVCPGEIVTLDASLAGTSLLWQDGSTGAFYSATLSGTYWVDASLGSCVARDSFELSYHVLPEIDLGNDTVLCIGESLVLDATQENLVSYSWQDGSLFSAFLVYEPGWYWVEAQHLCASVTDSIFVDNCNCSVFVPNVFTPNDDRHNPQFQVYSNCVFTEYRLRIFNRWGELIFNSGDPTESWSGLVKGRPAPIGVYSWTLDYETEFLDKRSIKDLSGSVTILR